MNLGGLHFYSYLIISRHYINIVRSHIIKGTSLSQLYQSGWFATTVGPLTDTTGENQGPFYLINLLGTGGNRSFYLLEMYVLIFCGYFLLKDPWTKKANQKRH